MGNVNVNAKVKKSDQNQSQTSLFTLFSNTHSVKSDGSLISTFSALRNFSRKDLKKTPIYDLSASKTCWPVPHIESLFLPEFKVKGQILGQDFQLLELISTGAFGKVYKACKEDSMMVYAIKVMQKSQIIQNDAVDQVKDEVKIHASCGHCPFIVSCCQYWQTRKQIFIVTEYIPNGELLQLLNQWSTLPECLVRIYVAELALVLDFLHNIGVIYRDLKPENILLDENYHIKLTDFGLSKWLSIGKQTTTICGTLQYSAPEILQYKPYSHAVDWWSLGILTCLLLTGEYPIRNNEIITGEGMITLPANDKLTTSSMDLLNRLLQIDPKFRLRSLYTLKTVSFFMKFNFDDVRAKRVNPKEILTNCQSTSHTNCKPESDDFVDF